jgi:hypothetical protein
MPVAAPQCRPRFAAALVAVSIAAGAAAAPAAAAPVFRFPRPLPRYPLPHPSLAIPRVFEQTLRYGIRDTTIIVRLRTVETAVVDDVRTIAAQQTSETTARSTIEECAGEGLKTAGESYRDAVRQAPAGQVPPVSFDLVGEAIAGCIGAVVELPLAQLRSATTTASCRGRSSGFWGWARSGSCSSCAAAHARTDGETAVGSSYRRRSS